jgi:chemotaxis family two-component system sensor kinase Cph1
LGTAIADSAAQVFYNGLPVVTGDREQLVRLLQNLISNAIKHRSQAAPLISVAAHRNDQDWISSVSDNGIGIDAKYTEQVFELFERLHGSHTSGVGIGLAISKRIVELHRVEFGWSPSRESDRLSSSRCRPKPSHHFSLSLT